MNDDKSNKVDISEKKLVKILYTNYRNETAVRSIIPIKIWFGKTDWHPKEQWLLDAYDIEKQANRSFALIDVQKWDSE